MSKQPAEQDEWLANRILILGYVFRRYLGRRVPNNAVAMYSNYYRYIAVRDRLAARGLIRVEASGRGVDYLELTDDGVMYVANLLANGLERPSRDQGAPSESPEVVFVKKLRLVQLMPTRIGSKDAEKLFKALAMLYPDGFFKNGPVPEFINQMSDDIAKDGEIILRKMVDSFDILYKIDIDSNNITNLIKDVIVGYNFLERMAVLSRIWRFYRFSPYALHTVVRFAALFELGSMGQKLKYAAVAIYGALAFTGLMLLGLITPETRAVTGFAVFILGLAFLIISIAAKLPFKLNTASKQGK